MEEIVAWATRAKFLSFACSLPEPCGVFVGKVRKELPSQLVKAGVTDVPKKLHQQQPLDIQAKIADKALCSYKAPWSQELCIRALGTAMMYEAGANVLWLSTGLGTQARVAHEQPSVQSVLTVMASYFSKETLWSPKALSKDRLVWPITMEAYTLTKGELYQNDFDHSLALLGGHTMLFAWYGAMFNALMKHNSEMIRLLWECGLTVTVNVQISAFTSARTNNNNKL